MILVIFDGPVLVVQVHLALQKRFACRYSFVLLSLNDSGEVLERLQGWRESGPLFQCARRVFQELQHPQKPEPRLVLWKYPSEFSK